MGTCRNQSGDTFPSTPGRLAALSTMHSTAVGRRWPAAAALEGMTPRSVWCETGSEISIDQVMELLAVFGSARVVVKDFVKSRKHEGKEACFIPPASAREAVERVVRRFMELQGDDLAGGLVFRQFVELEHLGRHPKSGMPLTREFRLFFANHRLIACFPCQFSCGARLTS